MVSYCTMLMRPGVHAWTVELEYTMFKPDTDANDGFHLAIMKWPDDVPPPAGLYAVVTFEKRAQVFAEGILWKHGLRKVRKGYTQMVISGVSGKAVVEKFPITGPNVFFLENHSKGAANVIYTNDPVKIRIAHEHEVKQAQVFFDEHERWLQTEEGKAIADAFWKKHPEGHVE
jgi:hypothetical protein